MTRRQLLSLLAGLAGLPLLRQLLHRLEILGLITDLHDKNPVHQATAIWSLGDLGPLAHAAVPALRHLLNDDCEAVRCEASVALGQITGDWTDALTVGQSLLQHPDEWVRVIGEEHLERSDVVFWSLEFDMGFSGVNSDVGN